MADIFGSQNVNTIQQRLTDYIKQHGSEESVIEGTFKRDIINSTSEEFKNVYFEIDMLRDAIFASTSWGDYLTEKCSDFGIDRKLAAKAKGVRFGREKMAIPDRFYELQTRYRDGCITARAAARELGVAHSTFLKWNQLITINM